MERTHNLIDNMSARVVNLSPMQIDSTRHYIARTYSACTAALLFGYVGGFMRGHLLIMSWLLCPLIVSLIAPAPRHFLSIWTNTLIITSAIYRAFFAHPDPQLSFDIVGLVWLALVLAATSLMGMAATHLAVLARAIYRIRTAPALAAPARSKTGYGNSYDEACRFATLYLLDLGAPFDETQESRLVKKIMKAFGLREESACHVIRDALAAIRKQLAA